MTVRLCYVWNKCNRLTNKLLAKLPKSKPISDEIAEIRYMIEELRVSLFAQQLGTKYQVSG